MLILRSLQMLAANLNAHVQCALRLAPLDVVMALALVVMTAFVAAALFVTVLQAFGLVAACVSCAGMFGLIAVVVAAHRRRVRRDLEDQRALAVRSRVTDPVAVAAAVELARAIGMKRLLPLLALGGIAAVIAARWTPSDRREPGGRERA